MRQSADVERLLARALSPVEPPAALTGRVERRMGELRERGELAVEELEGWELAAMRDPRNWVRVARPVAAAVVGAGAGTALVVLRARRRRRGPLRELRDATRDLVRRGR